MNVLKTPGLLFLGKLKIRIKMSLNDTIARASDISCGHGPAKFW